MNRVVLQLDPSPRNARNSEATFIRLKSGRILLIWSKFTGKSHSDFGNGDIACRWSDDGGATWSTKERILVKRDRGALNVMSPSALRLNDGRIALLYLRKVGHHLCIPYFVYSTDECATFSKPVQVILAPGYYVVNNDRMIQLRTGRIIVPVGVHRMRGPWRIKEEQILPGDEGSPYPKALEPRLAEPAIITHYFSDDGGKIWLESIQSYYTCFDDGSGCEEPGVLELKDGRLWSWARTGLIGISGYRQWQSCSKDKGQHWSAPEASQFVSPCSPMQVKRLHKTGHLLAVWNDHSKRFKVPKPKPISWARTPLVCAISTDEGKTWKHHKLLESAPDHGFCYPAVYADEKCVLLSYNAGGATSQKPLDTQRVRQLSYEYLYS